MKRTLSFLILLLLFSLAQAEEETTTLHWPSVISEFPLSIGEDEPNPYVPIDLWNELKPYFLPDSHPVKRKLDKIFSKKRVTLSKKSFEEAGFSITRENRPFNANVSGHKKLKGYLVKVYLDSQFEIEEWKMWLKRIKGIEVIRKCLQRNHFTQFVLPRKWIYPLPAEPSPPDGYNRKNFILVVEDMDILDKKENKKAYQKKMTRSLLRQIYIVMTECELTDCVWIGNMPFTKNGKIAFVDTELFYNGTPDFQAFRKYLSIPMQNEWDKLTRAKKL